MEDNDKHVIEALGKSKILIRDGKVLEVSDPKITYCPLFEKYRGIKNITAHTIKDIIHPLCSAKDPFPSS